MLNMITGFAGMVGTHLAEHLIRQKEQVVGVYFSPTVPANQLPKEIECRHFDIRDALNTFGLLKSKRPDVIYHLAAQSYPTVSWSRPVDTLEINVIGTVNLFESVRLLQQEVPSYDPVIVVACSSAQYGSSLTPENVPIKEDAPLLPLSPYGVSKVAQDLLAYQYFQNYGIRTVRARIFNTTGPRKVGDVASDFTMRAVAVERGHCSTIRVGNLETKRAITDVRDLVNALHLLAKKGHAGEAYNISGSSIYSIKEILDHVISQTRANVEVSPDPSLLRPTDEPVIFGDSTKLNRHTGWVQSIPIERTIADMMNYWRENEEVSI